MTNKFDPNLLPFPTLLEACWWQQELTAVNLPIPQDFPRPRFISLLGDSPQQFNRLSGLKVGPAKIRPYVACDMVNGNQPHKTVQRTLYQCL
jgi:hypothetical protein